MGGGEIESERNNYNSVKHYNYVQGVLFFSGSKSCFFIVFVCLRHVLRSIIFSYIRALKLNLVNLEL